MQAAAVAVHSKAGTSDVWQRHDMPPCACQLDFQFLIDCCQNCVTFDM